MKDKISKGLLITVVILVLVILVLILKLANDTTSVGKEANTVSDNSTQEIEKIEGTKDFDLKEAEQILDKFGFNEDTGCNTNIYSFFYSESFKQTIVLKKVSDLVKTKKKCSEIYSKQSQYIDAYEGENGVCPKGKEVSIIPYGEANKIYKDMYGTDMPKKGFTTSDIGSMYYNLYDYNESLNSFVQLSCGGCGGACGDSLININKIKSAYTLNDNLIIDVYYFHTYELGNGETEGKEYKYVSTTKEGIIKLLSRDVASAKKEIEEKYLDKLDVYEVVFTKKDGNYIFKSLTKKLS